MTGDDLNDGLTWGTAKKTIMAAIGTCSSGDTITVAETTQNESIDIISSKSNLVLQSRVGDIPVIHPPGDTGVRISASDCTMRGFKVENVIGISLSSSNGSAVGVFIEGIGCQVMQMEIAGVSGVIRVDTDRGNAHGRAPQELILFPI